MIIYDLCLLNPPSPWLVHPRAQSPLGILYLAAIARGDGLSVIVRDLCGADAARPESWDIPLAACYGITGAYLHIEGINALAGEIRRRNRYARILVGGPVTLSRDALDMRLIDTVVLGEGERIISRLARQGGDKVETGEPADVSAIPCPARDLWAGPFGGTVFIGGREYFGGGSATILTSRGCPFSCAFCASPALLARKVRLRDAGAVVAEMESLVTDFGVRQFRLSDEFFTCRPDHTHAVCAGIQASATLGHGKGLAWRASVGVRINDSAIFAAMAAAGCKEVSFGVESADPEVLALVTRKGSPDETRTALANARAAGLKTRALMMVGLPGETQETARLNGAFLRSGLFDAVAITVFAPVPGCDIAANPAAYGCRIIEERARRSLCMYDRDGRLPVLPTIETDLLADNDWARQMEATIAVAESLDTIGRG